MQSKLSLCALILVIGCHRNATSDTAIDASWDDVTHAARGETVTFAMWQGDASINAYMNGWVAPELERRYGVRLKTIGVQGGDIVALLMTEAEAGKAISDIDLVWINGETFYQLRQIDALAGPFVARLPNAAMLDLANPFISFDFRRPIAGYECPWGNVQMIMIYDSARVSDPPRTREQLTTWIMHNPGRFTFDTSFTGMTFLKSLLIAIAGGDSTLPDVFDEQQYQRASLELFQWLESVRPLLWKQGKTFPASVTQLHQLFAAGAIDFTMANNDSDADNRVLQGVFPKETRAYVLDSGMIQNSHYLGIPKRTVHLAGAMVVANFLISPEAQLEKEKPAVWGDGTVLAVQRLPPPWPEQFAHIPDRTHAPPPAVVREHALREPPAEYMVRLAKDFRERVLDQ